MRKLRPFTASQRKKQPELPRGASITGLTSTPLLISERQTQRENSTYEVSGTGVPMSIEMSGTRALESGVRSSDMTLPSYNIL